MASGRVTVTARISFDYTSDNPCFDDEEFGEEALRTLEGADDFDDVVVKVTDFEPDEEEEEVEEEDEGAGTEEQSDRSFE